MPLTPGTRLGPYTIGSRVCLCLKAVLEGRQDAALATIGEPLSTCAWNVEYWSWLVAEC